MTKKSTQLKLKTCFVIMPITDLDSYDTGHFSRVYSHLIKPACTKVGFTPIRADEVASSNYIVIDILSRIVESDLVICDLSGRNPNVLYELGIRQAFNLPTVLIKDIKTDKIFDIQGLRYTEYNHELRIDTVEKQIDSISNAIQETMKASGKDVNSLVQLLGIKPATLPSHLELSSETSVVLSAIKDLSNRILSLENSDTQSNPYALTRHKRNPDAPVIPMENGSYKLNGYSANIGDMLYSSGEEIGHFAGVTPEGIIVKTNNDMIVKILHSTDNFHEITAIPF